MKRRGFTLIELMVVIAIIIILAAIAIPNYLKMTERAKKSRLQSDFATLATVLETFKTDWGSYPKDYTAFEEVDDTTNVVYTELSASGTGVATINVVANTNAIGEKGPIEYIKPGTLTSMVNPFNAGTWHVMYGSNGGLAVPASTWLIYAQTATAEWMVRTDNASTPVIVTVAPILP